MTHYTLLSSFVAAQPPETQATLVRCVAAAAAANRLTCAPNGLSTIAGERTHDLFLYLDEKTQGWLEGVTAQLAELLSPSRDFDVAVSPELAPHLTPALVHAMCQVKRRPARSRDRDPGGAGKAKTPPSQAAAQAAPSTASKAETKPGENAA